MIGASARATAIAREVEHECSCRGAGALSWSVCAMSVGAVRGLMEGPSMKGEHELTSVQRPAEPCRACTILWFVALGRVTSVSCDSCQDT